MLVINLFGGPGSGKSTSAAGIFYKIKKDTPIRIELVTEYAKDLVWEDRLNILEEDSLYVVAKQARRITRLEGKVDVVVTDSPILLAAAYCDDKKHPFLEKVIYDLHLRYNTHNIFINRDKAYARYGRLQEEEEAKKIDLKVKNLLNQYLRSYTMVTGVDQTVDEGVRTIINAHA